MENSTVKKFNIIQFVSEPRKTFFAPEWCYFLGETFAKDIDFSKVAKLILSKEKQIIENFPPVDKANSDGYTGLGSDSLTSRYKSFNVLAWDDEEIIKIKKAIQDAYLDFLSYFNAPRRIVWIQCWANVLREGQEIKPHLHSTGPHCYLGGHVCVQCDNTSTVYINPINQLNDPEIFSSDNQVGKITLFQNNIPHYTTKHVGTTERITIAFDIIVDEDAKDFNNLVLLDNV